MKQQAGVSVIYAVIAIFIIALLGFGLLLIFQRGSLDDQAENPISQTTPPPAETSESTSAQTIAEIVRDTPELSLLANAIQSSNIETTLKGPGPYTFLAPNNEAFEDVTTDIRESLQQPGNNELRTRIFQRHILSDNVVVAQLTDNQTFTTLSDTTIIVNFADNEIFFVAGRDARSKLVTADIAASNGTIHIVDAVLLP